jgi:hypothetical protein
MIETGTSLPSNWEVTTHKCPICNHLMHSKSDEAGELRAGGFTLWCSQPMDICPSQDVSGHAKTVKDAFQIVQEKFVARKDR